MLSAQQLSSFVRYSASDVFLSTLVKKQKIVYLLSHRLSSCVPVLCQSSKSITVDCMPLSATFSHPPALHSVSQSLPFSFFFSAPPLSAIHPPSLSRLPIIPLSPRLSLPTPCLFCSGPICSHYTDGPDDSLGWCPLSLPGASPRLFFAAFSHRSAFSLGTMTAWHLLLSCVTSRHHHRDKPQRDEHPDMLLI